MASTEDLAMLSMEVYKNNATTMPYGWTFLDEPTAAQKATGLYAIAYQNTATGEIVIAYRGTTVTDTSDLAADIALTVGGEHPQFVAALEFANSIRLDPRYSSSTITVTGHSLGGGLAQLAADVFGFGGVTFDAPGMDQLTTGAPAHQFDQFFAETGESFGHIPANAVDPENPSTLGFTNLTVSGSVISSVGEHIGVRNSIDVENGTLNVIELMAAWAISGVAAVPFLLAAKNQLDRHFSDYSHQRTQRTQRVFQ